MRAPVGGERLSRTVCSTPLWRFLKVRWVDFSRSQYQGRVETRVLYSYPSPETVRYTYIPSLVTQARNNFTS